MENSGGDNETKSPDYKLTYFDVQWDGEQTRLMFVYRGILFEDVRLPLKLGENDWPIPSQLVDQIPEDVRLSMNRLFQTNVVGFSYLLFNLELAGETLPLLEIKGGETIAGVKSTAKFVARKLGFLGQNDSDVAKIDEILEVAYGFSEGKRKTNCCRFGGIRIFVLDDKFFGYSISCNPTSIIERREGSS